MDRYQVIVVGGGAVGAATAWALASRGRRVAMVERFEPGHARGSSHASARVFRLGYEDADYITMARQARDLWRQLEAESGASLLELTGVIDHGPTEALEPVVRAFTDLDVPHEHLTPAQAETRWPGMRFDSHVVVHPDGGRVYAQKSLDVLYALARRGGADLRFGNGLSRLEVDDDGGVAVLLQDGTTLQAETVVMSVGSWASKLLDGLVELPALQVSNEQPMFFKALMRDAAGWPPFVHRGVEDIYGFGVPGEGVKVAEHYRPEWLDPDTRTFDEDPAATARVSDYIRRWIPGLDPRPISLTRCLYTTTPDKEFVMDRSGPIVVGAGFSGHGFKFTPLIGTVLADLADGAEQTNPRFRLGSNRQAYAGTR